MTTPTFLNPEDLHAPGGYSHAVTCSGRLLVVSGQIGFDKDRKIVGENDFSLQCAQAFENLVMVLKSGGAKPSDVVRLGIILSDRQYLPELRKIRAQFFPAPLPASTLIIAGLILPELKIEVEALAQLPA
ncbi:RidA family protein [Limibacillus sp. MBR-115]|jgi:enamine deaminase RidA (YjgF/YER057c/UK114 family)|uniref:RidA family protein n=1 Tax=Limibacillus sp. MBR-115 TaxID=3156465 RepID=UPI00339A05A3